MTIYCVFSAYTSSRISLLATTKASVFLLIVSEHLVFWPCLQGCFRIPKLLEVAQFNYSIYVQKRLQINTCHGHFIHIHVSQRCHMDLIFLLVLNAFIVIYKTYKFSSGRSDMLTWTVTEMSPGSHVVKLPIKTRISRLACEGNIRKERNASSKAFCSESSPLHATWLNCWTAWNVTTQAAQLTNNNEHFQKCLSNHMYLTSLIFTDRSYKSTDAGNHTIK